MPTYIETKQAEARAEAQAETRKAVLLDLVQRRFGEVAEDARRTIEGGTEEQMRVWTCAVLEARSIRDLLDTPVED